MQYITFAFFQSTIELYHSSLQRHSMSQMVRIFYRTRFDFLIDLVCKALQKIVHLFISSHVSSFHHRNSVHFYLQISRMHKCELRTILRMFLLLPFVALPVFYMERLHIGKTWTFKRLCKTLGGWLDCVTMWGGETNRRFGDGFPTILRKPCLLLVPAHTHLSPCCFLHSVGSNLCIYWMQRIGVPTNCSV